MLKLAELAFGTPKGHIYVCKRTDKDKPKLTTVCQIYVANNEISNGKSHHETGMGWVLDLLGTAG